jgi:hypothetical protein
VTTIPLSPFRLRGKNIFSYSSFQWHNCMLELRKERFQMVQLLS